MRSRKKVVSNLAFDCKFTNNKTNYFYMTDQHYIIMYYIYCIILTYECGLACFCLGEVFEMRFTVMSFRANVVQNIFQQFSIASLLFDTVVNYSSELSLIYISLSIFNEASVC